MQGHLGRALDRAARGGDGLAMTTASIHSDFAAARQLPGDPQATRARLAALTAAVALHAGLGALLLLAPWKAAPPERVVYDLVFVEPAAPPTAAPQSPAAPQSKETAAAPDRSPQTAESSPPPAADPQSEQTVALDDPVPLPQTAESLPLPSPARPTRPPKPPVTPPRVQPPRQHTAAAPVTPPAAATAKATASAAALELTAVSANPLPEVAPHPVSDGTYAARLQTWLDGHKEYPFVARRRGVQGRVVLRLAVARNGKVAEMTIETSSGAEILDRAALDMVHRADPLPPLPASVPGPLAEFRVPIEFVLAQ